MTEEIQNYTGSVKAHKVHRHVSHVKAVSFDLDSIFKGMQNTVLDGRLLKFLYKAHDHCNGNFK